MVVLSGVDDLSSRQLKMLDNFAIRSVTHNIVFTR